VLFVSDMVPGAYEHTDMPEFRERLRSMLRDEDKAQAA
jgi:hypothetical protein